MFYLVEDDGWNQDIYGGLDIFFLAANIELMTFLFAMQLFIVYHFCSCITSRIISLWAYYCM